jgi:hypothetical protein
LKTEEESWSIKGRCSALDLRGATREFMLVLPHRDLISAQVNRVGIRECKLQAKDFRLHNGDLAQQLPVSSLYTPTTTEEQQCAK